MRNQQLRLICTLLLDQIMCSATYDVSPHGFDLHLSSDRGNCKFRLCADDRNRGTIATFEDTELCGKGGKLYIKAEGFDANDATEIVIAISTLLNKGNFGIATDWLAAEILRVCAHFSRMPTVACEEPPAPYPVSSYSQNKENN